MPYTITYPSRVRDAEQVGITLEASHECTVPTPKRAVSTSGVTFDKILARLLEPDQLEWTANELSAAASGIQKVIRLAIPADELSILRKHKALALPTELIPLGENFTIPIGMLRVDGKFKAPLDQLSSMGEFVVPFEWAAQSTRPKSDLGEAFNQQLARMQAAVSDHQSRLEARVKEYMFGRPVVTLRQRRLDNIMDAYPEFDWAEQILPYLAINHKDNGQ